MNAGFKKNNYQKYILYWLVSNHITPIWINLSGLLKPVVRELYLHCTAHYICLGVVPLHMISNQQGHHSKLIISGSHLNQILHENNFSSKIFQKPNLYHSLVLQRAARVLNKSV